MKDDDGRERENKVNQSLVEGRRLDQIIKEVGLHYVVKTAPVCSAGMSRPIWKIPWLCNSETVQRA